MGIREDGKQHYFERFPDQLQVLYGGRRGYLYIIDSDAGLTNTKGRTWESTDDKITDRCETIENVYEEILKEEKEGNVVIHRYDEIDSAEQKNHANYIKKHINDNGQMKPFYLRYFSDLWA